MFRQIYTLLLAFNPAIYGAASGIQVHAKEGFLPPEGTQGLRKIQEDGEEMREDTIL